MATVESIFAVNVGQLRKRRGYSVRELAGVMEKLGKSIDPSGVTKLENGTRRPRADELVALALALGVSPNRLLLPGDDRGEDFQVTPEVAAPASRAWSWADGQNPLLAAIAVIEGGDKPFDPDRFYEFQRDSRPRSEWEREQHTAVRACRDVLYRLHSLIGGEPDTDWDGQPVDPRAKLRGALKRLNAEIDDLLGDDDGER